MISFKDLESSIVEFHSIDNFEERSILQTCNRIEIYIVFEGCENLARMTSEYLTKKPEIKLEEAASIIDVLALNHL